MSARPACVAGGHANGRSWWSGYQLGQRLKHGAWHTVAHLSRALNTDDAAKISVRASHTGRYLARASFAGDATNAPARSGWTRFRVR